MKSKILLILSAIGVSIIGMLIMGDCSRAQLTDEDVEQAIEVTDEGKFISPEKYEELKQIYLDNQGNEDDFDGVLNDILKRNEEEWGTVKVLKPTNKQVSASVYLDNTASMKGFFEPKSNDSDIKKLVGIFNELRENLGDTVPSYYIDRTGMVRTNLGSMSKQINNRDVKTHDAYSMSGLLDTIVNRTLADTVRDVMSYFITDAIMSGSNEDIRKDPQYNINHAETLSKDIANVLRKLKNRNYGFAMLRYTANYDNDYINYHNGKTLINKERPIYVVVIGPQNEIKKLNSGIEESNKYRPEKKLIAATRPSSPFMSVMLGNENILSENGILNIDSKQENPEVSLRFSLKNQPEYFLDDSTAKNALDVTFNGTKLDLQNATYNEGIVSIKRVLKDKTEFPISIGIKKKLPEWVEKLKSDNDEDILSQTDKTFNLDWFVKGLIDGIFDLPSGDYLTEKKSEYTVVLK